MSDPRKRSQETLERIKIPIDTALLDDISRGIRQLNNKLAAQVLEGIQDEAYANPSGVNAVSWQSLTKLTPPYFRATVFNDGPSSVYVMLNVVKPVALRQAPLNAGDSAPIDTSPEAKIKALFFACPNSTDTASLRIYLLR